MTRRRPVPADELRLSYSVAEAATVLGTSYEAVVRLIKSGQLPHFTVGEERPKRLIPARALEAFVNSHINQTNPAA